MKPYALALAAAVLCSAACSQKAETSVPAESGQASAVSDAGGSVQTLTGSDGKISIVIPGNRFEDASGGDLPEGLSAGELTLLQRDNNRDITLYIANLGTPKTDAETYFDNLKTVLDADQSLSDVQTGAATDTRMNYRFVQNGADGTALRENCIAIYETGLYNVCASSRTAAQEELAEVLREVNLAN